MANRMQDRAITVFSSDGQLLQVEYAQEAAKKGSSVVGIRGNDVVVIASEKKAWLPLQDSRTDIRIAKLDKHLLLAFAGLRADARVIITRLTIEDAATVEYITKYISDLKQLYTQSNGRRPFGISCLIAGVNPDDSLHLFQTDPAGLYYEWKAVAIGRNDKINQAYLEKNYSQSRISSEDGCVNLALTTLLASCEPNVVKEYDVAVLKRNQPATILQSKEVQAAAAALRNSIQREERGRCHNVKSRWPM